MRTLAEHPTVKRFHELAVADAASARPARLDAGWLRALCLDAGADDVGFVEIDRPEIADQRADILAAFSSAKTLVSVVCRLNAENMRSPARSVANLEFHLTGDHVDEVARKVVTALDLQGVRARNGGAMGFPMEMDRWPDRIWVVAHKPVAVAAGLGHMGLHRNVIHPKFGNFILLGTILLDAEVTAYDTPIDYNPCLDCKLCVAACPVGAIEADGHFDFSACFTHNYRELMGGFTDWVEIIADSRNARDYRRHVTDPESVSMWQGLAFGPNYKAAYCVAACPAGDDVIGPFLTDRKRFQEDVVKPFQDKVETVYVVPGSDAEAYVTRRFPHKRAKHVSNGIRPRSIRGFLDGMPFLFQRHQSKGLDATYHFTFTGEEACTATVAIRNETLEVQDGHVGRPDIRIVADSRVWLRFLAKEQSLVWALLRGTLRIKGSPRLLMAFGRCFPSGPR